MNRMQAWSGMFGCANRSGLVSPDYAVFDILGNHYTEFVLLRLRAPDLVDQFALHSKGIGSGFNRLYTDRFGAIHVALPPHNDQIAIVRFLDWATARLDRAIQIKRKLIALLNEQKRAIIHQAVTRGLDPNMPLKASGIPWLGNIPENWQMRRLRTLIVRIDQGVSPHAEAMLAEDGSWGVLKSGCVNHGVFRETEHKRLPDGFSIDESLAVKLGDVLVSRACGSPALVGSVASVQTLRYNLILSDKTFRLIFSTSELANFLVIAMNSWYYRVQVEQAISGAEGLAKNLPLSSLKDFTFAIPPSEEIGPLLALVRNQLQQIVFSIARTEKEIKLLREYRTRLIADVSTGKFDVRGVQIPVDEMAESAKPLEPTELESDDEQLVEEYADAD